eukprot:1519883-Pyramimonas_sp.AAC.1
MKCGPHRRGAPARDFLAIDSRTRLPPYTSSMLRPQEPNSDDGYKRPMTQLGFEHEVQAP